MIADRIWQLLAKKINGELEPEESAELNTLIVQNQELFRLHEQLAGIRDLSVAPVGDKAAQERSLAAIKARLGETDDTAPEEVAIPETTTLRLHMRRWLAAAAVFLVLLTGGAFYLLSGRGDDSAERTAGTAFNEISTTGGSKSRVNLPDGTFVIVNAQSKLRYNKDFGKKSREIFLEGEAYFNVQKNAEMPLVVHSGNVDVIVTGTIFNVRAYPGDDVVEASLLQGAIAVMPHGDPERKIILRPDEKIIIGNKKAISSANKKGYLVESQEERMVITKIKHQPTDSLVAETAWIEDKMLFNATPFEEVAKRMGRWYNVSVTINDSTLKSMPLTGSFEKEDLTEALEALRMLVPFNYTIVDRQVTISR
ncbi:FecR domain-containing protein [Chitinophaga sp. MM2321]|uniref:FecR domain-containing protein n=1 Tax=Chitinophaga sp. MM2321 TaxID=3137178 RepID=UPI0032D592AD